MRSESCSFIWQPNVCTTYRLDIQTSVVSGRHVPLLSTAGHSETMESVITSYAGCLAVLRDPVTFTVDDPRFSTGQIVGESMLSTDGHRHQTHRDQQTIHTP